MRRSSVARLVAASTIVSLVVAGLSGCFLLPRVNPLGSGDETRTSAPSDELDAGAGACWQTNYDDLALWSAWEGDGPVDCDEDHQSYTFLTEDLDADLEAELEAPYDAEGMTGELAWAISQQCRAVLEDEYDITDREKRIGFFFFAPTASEWDDGAREIRCDIALLGFGSDYLNGDIDLEDLPADINDLLDEVESNEVFYQLCLTGDGSGPYEGTEAIIEDCTIDYFWRYGGYLEYPGTTESDPYPEGDTLFDYAIDECPLLGIAGPETVYPYVPSEETWVQYGDRNIECWFSTLDAPSEAA